MYTVFRNLNFERKLSTIADLGYSNLVVSGCSNTYNFGIGYPTSWPYWLRDLGGFDRVLDTSMPGAGNQHIANSLHWALEVNSVDPKTSLVVVMWSGHDRDDLILPSSEVRDWVARFDYSKAVSTGITGGLHPSCVANLKSPEIIKSMAGLKSRQSRAIENYLVIDSLHSYLTNRKFNFVFLDYLDRSVPNRTCDFVIDDLLPEAVAKRLRSHKLNLTDLYVWALERNQLEADLVHVTPQGHCEWTRDVLMPKLQEYLYEPN